MADKKRGPGRPAGSKNKNTSKTTSSARTKTSQSSGQAGRRGTTTQKKATNSTLSNEVAAIVLLAVGVFLAIAMQTSVAGAAGEVISGFLKGLFGFGAYFLPYFLVLYAVLMLLGIAIAFQGKTVVLLLLFFLSVDLINSARFVQSMEWGILGIQSVFAEGKALAGGGVFGMYAGAGLYHALGMAGLYLVAIVLMVVSCLLLMNTPLSTFWSKATYRRDLRRAKKEELEQEQRETAAKKAQEEAELQAKREALERAGRESTPYYKSPSYRAAAMSSFQIMAEGLGTGETTDKEEHPTGLHQEKPEIEAPRPRADRPKWGRLRSRTVAPKSLFSLWNQLSDTQLHILEMVAPGSIGVATPVSPGYGLDGSQPSRIGQEQDTKKESDPDRREEGLFFASGYGLDQEGSLKTASKEEHQQASWGFVGQGRDHVGEEYRAHRNPAYTPSWPEDRDTDFEQDTQEKAPEPPAAQGGEAEDRIPWEEPQAEKTPTMVSPTDGPLTQNTSGVIHNQDSTLTTGEKPLHPEPEVNGASIATMASTTETNSSEVAVTPKGQVQYCLPPLSLLNPPQAKGRDRLQEKEDLKANAELLRQTLLSFGVECRVVNVISGPSVTRYEIEPARGVKVNSITKLSDDLALNMRARSIRIEAPIPGKAAVGIEIENQSRDMVTMGEMLSSREFQEHQSKLAFTVGRDIGGKAVVADIAKMPHMLIAGATGSGKSVCINSIITSILYKAKPEEVKLVLVDPKMVELGNYNGIPHLLIPVVTDPTKAAAALQWAVAEMTDRYKKFAKTGVRDLGSYNGRMKSQGNTEEILPQIVIVIDELADLMMVASSQVEDAICRLAQLARAAGMHLVLATQRPSVDVITGLIKANIPSRIAFMVSSQIDSRTIIDMAGAEKLVGNGDMLFKPQDLNKPKRIQGPFVSDEEVERIIAHVKNQVEEPGYNQDVMDSIEKGRTSALGEEEDELVMEAMELVVQAGQASVSMLQRRFRIGYNRAARIIDSLEDRGIIGPQDGSRPRTVLVTWDQFQEIKAQEDL